MVREEEQMFTCYVGGEMVGRAEAKEVSALFTEDEDRGEMVGDFLDLIHCRGSADQFLEDGSVVVCRKDWDEAIQGLAEKGWVQR
jgi:hypothetical protein